MIRVVGHCWWRGVIVVGGSEVLVVCVLVASIGVCDSSIGDGAVRR